MGERRPFLLAARSTVHLRRCGALGLRVREWGSVLERPGIEHLGTASGRVATFSASGKAMTDKSTIVPWYVPSRIAFRVGRRQRRATGD